MARQCPTCQRAVSQGWPENPSAPFCSGRCKGVDLGRWLNESYRVVARDAAPDEATVAELERALQDPKRWS
ncbi:MAG: DNA gyrase inhibitor YacG [Myxococcales bacterium]|nr:DNA gyrase inhibitor YacG [Myxococcales bacterium]